MSQPTTQTADLSAAWDRLVQYLMGLDPEARAEALAHPGDTLESAGLGEAGPEALNSAITNSGSFNREYNLGNQSNSGGGGGGGGHAVASPPPPPDCAPRPGETHHEAAERVMNYYINNTYNEVIDQSTNIGGSVIGSTIDNRQVNGDHNQVGDGSTFGDNIDASGAHATVTTGDGNQVTSGDHAVTIGDGNTLDHVGFGDGNAIGDGSAIGDGNATGAGSVALGGGAHVGNLNTGAGAQVGDGSAFGTGSAASGGHVTNSGVQGNGNTTGFGSGGVNSGSQDASHGGAIGQGSGSTTSNNDEDNSDHHVDNSDHSQHSPNVETGFHIG